MAVIIPPAGVSAASFFTPVEFSDPARPPAILGDDIDPATGELRSILSGIHPVDSAVITRIRTLRGSGVSVQAVGHRFDRIRKVDDAFVRNVQDEVELMLADLVERGDIRLETVAVIEDGDTGHSYIEYTNLRTGERRKQILGS